MPHSNFHPALGFDDKGRLSVGGPLGDIDDDVARVVISAYVTQAPATRFSARKAKTEDAPPQGVSCANSVKLEGSSLKKARTTQEWGFAATVHDGPFRAGWAWATAELVELAESGGIEKYTWSQWVDIRP
jgi:hypothetical protein